jgi:hypothetical protein
LAKTCVHDPAILLRLSLWVFRMLADPCDPPVNDLAIMLPFSL